MLHQFFYIKHMTKITVAKSSGIDPEIMDATLEMILASGAKIEFAEKGYVAGNTKGIKVSSWNIIRKNKIFIKAPITTTQGGAYKNLNVTTRKFLALYSNVKRNYKK